MSTSWADTGMSRTPACNMITTLCPKPIPKDQYGGKDYFGCLWNLSKGCPHIQEVWTRNYQTVMPFCACRANGRMTSALCFTKYPLR